MSIAAPVCAKDHAGRQGGGAGLEALVGLSVRLLDPRACGSTVAVVGAGLDRATLSARLAVQAGGWVPPAASNLISRIISRFSPSPRQSPSGAVRGSTIRD